MGLSEVRDPLSNEEGFICSSGWGFKVFDSCHEPDNHPFDFCSVRLQALMCKNEELANLLNMPGTWQEVLLAHNSSLLMSFKGVGGGLEQILICILLTSSTPCANWNFKGNLKRPEPFSVAHILNCKYLNVFFPKHSKVNWLGLWLFGNSVWRSSGSQGSAPVDSSCCQLEIFFFNDNTTELVQTIFLKWFSRKHRVTPVSMAFPLSSAVCVIWEKKYTGRYMLGYIVSAKIALKDLSFWNPQYYMSCWPQQWFLCNENVISLIPLWLYAHASRLCFIFTSKTISQHWVQGLYF